jgi:hypothetical protein
MTTLSLTVAGLARTALVKEGSTSARLGVMVYHGHGMTAEKILSNFTANPDIVYVAPQGLRDDFGDTGFISGRSARSKFTRYNAKGDEDYQLDDALRARFAHIGTWAAFGFSGGAGHLRDYAQERAFPYAAWCLSHNTLQSDQVGPDGKFAMFGGAPVPPTQQWLGLNDDKTGRVPPKLDYEHRRAGADVRHDRGAAQGHHDLRPRRHATHLHQRRPRGLHDAGRPLGRRLRNGRRGRPAVPLRAGEGGAVTLSNYCRCVGWRVVAVVSAVTGAAFGATALDALAQEVTEPKAEQCAPCPEGDDNLNDQIAWWLGTGLAMAFAAYSNYRAQQKAADALPGAIEYAPLPPDQEKLLRDAVAALNAKPKDPA